MYIKIIKCVFVFFSFILINCAFAENKILRVCNDESGWPPYTYIDKMDKKSDKKVIGYSVDLLEMLMKDNNIQYKLSLTAWQRCLEMTKENAEYEMLLEFTENPERKESFLFSDPIYYTNSAIFYSKENKPNGLKIEVLEDLKKYKGCGLFGYNYRTYGFKEKELDQGSKTIGTAIEKVKAGRCDFLIEKLEVISGFSKTSNVNVLKDPDVGYQLLKMVPSTPFVMGISKKYPHAAELQSKINKTLKEYEKNGTLKKLLKKWI